MSTQSTDPAHKTATPATPQARTAPAVEEKEKKKGYSRNLKEIQRFERRISNSAHRVSKAFEKGMQTYLDEREKSLNSTRDGALVESYVNVAYGMSEGIAQASPVITDVAKAFNTKRTQKLMRNVMRSIPFVR